MTDKNMKIRGEVADKVFYDLPPDKARKKMSARDLAKLLSECEKDTPKFILLQHELNLRIVKEQSKPVKFGIFMAFIGVIVGWVLSQWQPFMRPTASDIMAQQMQTKTFPIEILPSNKPENTNADKGVMAADEAEKQINVFVDETDGLIHVVEDKAKEQNKKE